MKELLQQKSNITQETDTLGGFGVIPSDIYPMTIKQAYYTKAATGAIAVNILAADPNNNHIKQTFYVVSGTAKGHKNFYIDRNGEEQYLPGFIQANAITLLGTRKPIGDLITEKKTLMLYSPKMKKEVPTEVDFISELVGVTILMGIIKQKVDKTKLNDATGKYEPTGETREENEVIKIFRLSDGKTVPEILAKAETAEFKDKWLKKWKGVTKIKAKGLAGVAVGLPSSPEIPVPSGNTAPAESIFAE